MSRQNSTWRKWIGGVALSCSPAIVLAQAPAPNAALPVPLPENPGARLPVGAPQAPTKALAVVNGEIISAADLELALKQAGPSPVALTEGQSKQMKMDVLRMLIDAALMRQFLVKYAPPASPADVSKKVAELEDGLKKQGKSLADHLRETHQNESMLRTAIGFASQWENYAQARVTEADVQRYYTEYKDFFDGITVRASHIVLRISPDAPPADQTAAKAKLTTLRSELLEKKGDFAQAAKAYSQCPSKENGGDIGYITRKWGMVDEGFARAAFTLPPGQVSDVVQTEYGLHLIKVTDRKAGQASDYAKIKEDVRQFYVEEMRQGLLAQQRKAAKLEVNLANVP